MPMRLQHYQISEFYMLNSHRREISKNCRGLIAIILLTISPGNGNVFVQHECNMVFTKPQKDKTLLDDIHTDTPGSGE